MLHKRIKELRNEHNLTQSELAEKLGCTQSAIAFYEKGDRSPDNSTLIKMADLFDCTLDYLMGRTDKRNLVVLEGNLLPEPLKSVIDAVNIAKDAGLSEKDIKEILELQARIKANN